MSSTVQIRPRRDADLSALEQILAHQQAETQYPFEWPLPYPVVNFLRRANEIGSWVAELDGEVVGHVAVTGVGDDELGRMWAEAHDVPLAQLRCVSVLFADLRHRGKGVGSALLAAATEAARANRGAPVLDVVPDHEAPVALYRKNGWQEIGRYRTHWLPDDVDPVYVMILPRDQALS